MTALKLELFRDPTREFHFAKTSNRYRDKFFAAIAPCNYAIRAIVIDKTLIHSEHLRENPSKLKSFAIMQLLSHHYGQIQDAKLIIDGQDTKGFGVSDRSYLMRRVNSEAPGTLRAVEFADSAQNQMIQLADMVTSGLYRGIREDDKQDGRYLRLLRPRTFQPEGSLWRYR